MAHIHTGDGHHDLTACGFVVRVDGPEPVMLLHEHRLLHKWLQFGGHVELHENPWQAVAREIKEESGYDLSQLKLLQPNIKQAAHKDAVAHPWPVSINTHKFGGLSHFHTDIAYAFTATGEPRHKIAEDESPHMRGFTRDELAALKSKQIPDNVNKIDLMIMDDYLKNWQQVTPPPVQLSR